MSKLLSLWDDMTGVVLDYALSTPPSAGWLLCFGQALTPEMTEAARLRTKLLADGSPRGVDGSGNPRVPDIRGRGTAGKDNMGGTAANRLTTANGLNGSLLGATGGTQTHTLTTAQMPVHAHAVTDPGHAHTVYDPGHVHWADGFGTSGSGGSTNFAVDTAQNKASRSVQSSVTGVSIYAAATGVSIQNNGSGNAHPITQPTVIMNKIIKL